MLKNSSTFSVSVPINLSIKLDFVSVNSPRDLLHGCAMYYVFPLFFKSQEFFRSIHDTNMVTIISHFSTVNRILKC